MQPTLFQLLDALVNHQELAILRELCMMLGTLSSPLGHAESFCLVSLVYIVVEFCQIGHNMEALATAAECHQLILEGVLNCSCASQRTSTTLWKQSDPL